ncbi:MAG: hypothetical protein Tsb0034_13310 [Ekhidna sp.]
MGRLLKSYWFKSGSISLVNRTLIMFFAYLNFFLMARLFDKSSFGAWVIFLSILKFSESIRNSFIYNPLLKYLNSDDGTNHQEIKAASSFLNLGIALLCIFAFLILAGILSLFSNDGMISGMLIHSAVAIIGFNLYSYFNFLAQADLKFTGTLVSSSFKNFFLFVCLLWYHLSQAEITLIRVVWLYNFGYVGSVIIAYLFISKQNGLFSMKRDLFWIKKLSHFGKYTFGTNLSSMINKSSKEWLLSGLINNAAVAIYAPALRIINFFEIPLNALASVYYPKVINEVKEKGVSAARELYEKSVSILFYLFLPVCLLIYFLAEQIISLLMGPGFEESVPILEILVFVGVMGPFIRQFGVTLNAIGEQRISFQFMVATSISGLLVSAFCIVTYGIIGAAQATMIIYLGSLIVTQVILHKKLSVNTLRIFAIGPSLIFKKRSIRN